MGTSFKSIYKRFLNHIDDPTFAEMSDEDALTMMHEMLIAAIANVREFKDGGYTLTEDKTAFQYTLSIDEKEVLALGMVQLWEMQQANSVTLTRHFISSKEELFFAQHNHLNGLLNLASASKLEKERIRSRYKTLHNSYLDTEEALDESDDFDELDIDDDGGSGSSVVGTTDYNKLINKPSINNVTLQGNLEITGFMSEENTVTDSNIDIMISSAFGE